MSEMIMRGEITFDPDAVGKGFSSVMLVGKIMVDGGVPLLELLYDYHVCYAKRPVVLNGALVPGEVGQETLWMVSRPVAERAKYPNWPKPEPQRGGEAMSDGKMNGAALTPEEPMAGCSHLWIESGEVLTSNPPIYQRHCDSCGQKQRKRGTGEWSFLPAGVGRSSVVRGRRRRRTLAVLIAWHPCPRGLSAHHIWRLGRRNSGAERSALDHEYVLSLWQS